jgi:hypothetical protein
MGHANIDVTRNVYGKSWREEQVNALTRAVEAAPLLPKLKRKKLGRISLSASGTNGCPFACPQPGGKLQIVECPFRDIGNRTSADMGYTLLAQIGRPRT